MSELARTATIIGAAVVLCGLPALLVPDRACVWIKVFPRSVVAGWVLTAVDLGWASWLLYHAIFLAEIAWARQLVVILVPVAFVVLIFFLDELLAPRALGGLLLLVPLSVLDAARWHESQWRLVLVVLMYVCVLTGIVLMLSPYRFRQVTGFLTRSNIRSRLVGAIGLAIGGCIICLGLAVF